MEYIALHFKFQRRVRRTLLAYMAWHFVKVANILT